MTSLLDTSVILRYITGDPRHQLPATVALLDSDEQLFISDVAILEAAFALSRFYRLTREEVVDALTELLGKANVDVFKMDKDVVIEALRACRPSNRVSFGDALIWAAARSSSEARVYTFDARFPSGAVDTIRLK